MASHPEFDRLVPAGERRHWTVVDWSLIVCAITGRWRFPVRRSAAEPASDLSAPAAAVKVRAQGGGFKTLEVTILSTMLADRAGVGEWGFSALVETDGHRILFDTGSRPETVLQNARELKIDLSDVTEVDPKPPSWRPRRRAADTTA